MSLSKPMIVATSEAPKKEVDMAKILKKAKDSALRGGLSGAAAMAINVGALMWMRTTVNFQYKYGMGTTEALRHIYNDGGRGLSGVLRFYKGVGPALIQGPLSRFGDTAANDGAMALMDALPMFEDTPTFVKSIGCSAAAASFRIFLMPVDCLKTTMQVEGSKGIGLLGAKIKAGGPGVLWHGALGVVSATFVGHYPWFFTRNQLQEILPKYDRKTETLNYLGVAAIIGFCASAVSDTCSNSIRVLKTTKQTAEFPITYTQAFRQVVDKDGISGLMFRGLKTKIISNGFQGLLFNVLWRTISDAMAEREKAAK
mmetsp:Transcript_39533/g.79834  ORF Transcript_39533/g.79834 Transcript_39533/m.79834 type:complete len:313 (+) Transcript_39533:53-991(+)|eukprot:CAMPEP_0171622904 /NCGR_PEP_ID=MMETSP0990-20121206/17568_1 /TAXON_ID=483369 /ORGANISM="non described non described, Strain CCMP2098" /LENGTH=312 /DNA_ID=CAMNT_0012188885 /DNA_START=51 /DNA_END=989 /DNA_ORIENTATION=+